MIITRDARGRIIQTTGHPPAPFNSGEAIALYWIGLSMAAVARILGTTYQAVQRRLIKFGVPSRGKGCRGRKDSPEIRRRKSESRRLYLQMHPQVGPRNSFYGRRHKKDSVERMKVKLSAIFAGSGNPQWRGGISREGYGKEFVRLLKRQIRTRDGQCCQSCGAAIELVVHHRDSDKLNNAACNLVTVCRRCHGLIHQSRLVLL